MILSESDSAQHGICCAQVIVSSPEEAQDGSGVMDRVMTLCDEFPAYFVQGFDWASSGNSYPRDAPLWAAFAVTPQRKTRGLSPTRSRSTPISRPQSP